LKVIQVPFCFYPDAVGGTEVYVASLARLLKDENRCDVLITAPSNLSETYETDGVRVRRFAVSSGVAELSELYGEGDELGRPVPAAERREEPFEDDAAPPVCAVGALASVWLMHMPLGFLVTLGITSLIGVIVSHVIVLFDFIEERHEEGENLRDSLIDAGIMRIRPVLITVAATVLALFPLALHGGPLWEALCYAQIGGLSFATLVTLFIVPVIYSIFVLDLKVVKWSET